MFNTRKLKPGEVQLQIMDWDKECEKDLRSGLGFIVSEKPFSKDDEKNDYGIQSKFFGTDFGDDDAFKERYSCKCESLQGKLFENEICPECKTKVELVDTDMDKYAWIVLNKYFLIHPMAFKFIDTIIPKPGLFDIINYNNKPDRNGNVVLDEVDKKNPFANIGMIEFRERFEEILLFYLKKKKQRKPIVDALIRNKDKVFIHCIPVFSAVLRPFLVRGDSITTNKFDTGYNKIFSSVKAINNSQDGSILSGNKRVTIPTHVKLFNLQKSLMEIWNDCFETLDHKEGHIKDGVLAGRINFTARNVIIPDKTLKANEIKLSYICAMELYKFEIMSYLVNIQKISESEAYDEWYKGTINFSEKIYSILKYMTESRAMYILLNRPPTIDMGSIDRMKVVDIIPDIENLTLSLPSLSVLTRFNADFDGDTLTVISLKTKKQIKMTEKFDPVYSYCVSQNDGLFSADMGLIKDQIIGLSNFNRC
jgi:DNA-directed RNA polymerase beta' subunit